MAMRAVRLWRNSHHLSAPCQTETKNDAAARTIATTATAAVEARSTQRLLRPRRTTVPHNRSGKVYLRITTAARYFKRYNLCVRLLPVGTDGTHAQRCGSYPVFRQGGSTWGSSINYARQFPITDPGRYRVTWKLGSGPLGPALYFRVPARS